MSRGTIELNGRQYDVATGQTLSASSARIKPMANTSGPSRSIDGFSVPKSHALDPQKPTHISPAQATAQLRKAPLHHVGQPIAKPLSRHQPQPTKTLIRAAVKRPNVTPKTAIKPQYSTDIMAKPTAKIAPKHSYYSTDPHKVSHAKSVAQSQKIKHFSDYQSAIANPSLASSDTSRARQAASNDYSQPTPLTNGRPASQIAAQQLSSFQASQHLPIDDDQTIFDQVLASARSHEQKPLKRTKKQSVKAHRRGLGVSASVLVVVLLGLFIAYQNRASINLQLASAKAGFHATTPSYKPTGYALKDISSSPGMVNIRYRAPQGNGIVIGQKESNWDSQTLQQNYLALGDQKYQTHHQSGKTIFTYGKNQATWVDGGIWYQIQGNATTSSKDLVAIAASM